MDTDSALRPSCSANEDRIGPWGTFTSPVVERAFRQAHFRDDRWLIGFLVTAGAIRAALFLLIDYQHFGVGATFWLLLGSRSLVLVVSACVLLALRRAASPAVTDRLFFGWAFLLLALTVSSLSARPPSNTGLLMMSFVVVIVTYCVTPLPLSRQAVLALSYSASILYVCREAEGGALSMVVAAHAMSNVFGAVMSWRLNRRRREAYLGTMREAQLRTSLEQAMAEIKTLRGLLCICAWCKRVRDEAQVWQAVEKYVQSRTHAEFSHGICPDCLRSQVGEVARLRR